MKFADRAAEISVVNKVEYACFGIEIQGGITMEMHIRHICGKIDIVRSDGNYGTPDQFMDRLYEICDYLKQVGYNILVSFHWTPENGIYFNLKSLALLLWHKQWLEDTERFGR